jgi:hypothetical protein
VTPENTEVKQNIGEDCSFGDGPRAGDKALAAITLVGTAAFAPVAIGFGLSIHNLADPRRRTLFTDRPHHERGGR